MTMVKEKNDKDSNNYLFHPREVLNLTLLPLKIALEILLTVCHLIRTT